MQIFHEQFLCPHDKWIRIKKLYHNFANEACHLTQLNTFTLIWIVAMVSIFNLDKLLQKKLFPTMNI